MHSKINKLIKNKYVLKDINKLNIGTDTSQEIHLGTQVISLHLSAL